MTYQEIIPRLSHELRDDEAWPSDTSKLAEQLNLLYNAALAVGKVIPLARLSLADSTALTGTSIGQKSDESFDAVQRYPLPSDAFDLRFDPEDGPLDYGIAYFLMDGRMMSPSESIRKETLLQIGNRGIHGERNLLALDYANGEVYASNVTELKVHYATTFTRPVEDNSGSTPEYTVLDWPLPDDDNDTQRAIHLVAAHVSGVTVRDPAMAQFQSLLEETYD